MMARRWALGWLVVAAVLITPHAEAACGGDCNGDGQVAIEELLRGVGIVIEAFPLDDCPEVDIDGDGVVTIDEVIAALNNAFAGCPIPATVTRTPGQINTRRNTHSPRPTATPEPGITRVFDPPRRRTPTPTHIPTETPTDAATPLASNLDTDSTQ